MTNAGNNDWLVALFTEAASAPVDVPAAKGATPANTSCVRCGGEGRISYYSHIKAGVCFACNGSGH
jgi:hypothetical protein